MILLELIMQLTDLVKDDCTFAQYTACDSYPDEEITDIEIDHQEKAIVLRYASVSAEE